MVSARLTVALIAVFLIFAAAPIAAQQKYKPPRLPDGHPDMQGIWINPTITPFERTAEFAGKATLTPEEVAAYEKRIIDNRNRPPRPGDVGQELFLDSGDRMYSTGQTSLVVDPPDGRIPTTPLANERRAYNLAHNSDSYEYMSPWDRCITRGWPGGIFPGGSNNAYRILQPPGYFVLSAEEIHEAHIVPTDGRPHLSSSIAEWVGDPVGHWEGDTLVVDIANFNDKGWTGTSAATGRMKGTPQTRQRHVVERFTRVSDKEIRYDVTIEDPPLFSHPWTVSLPLTRDDAYRIYEYSCHEGNLSVELQLGAGRAADRR